MIERLGELNEKFFELYGSLHYNDELLTDVQADFMAKCLFEQYVAEYERLTLACGIEENKEYMRLKMESHAYTPRRRFFRKNRALKQLISEVSVEIESYFKEREKLLDEYIRQQQEESEEEEEAQEAVAKPEEEPAETAEEETSRAEEKTAAKAETPEEVSRIEEKSESIEETPEEASKQTSKTGRKKKEPCEGQIEGQISFIQP